MTFINGIPEEEVTGKIAEIYEKEKKALGLVTDITKVFCLRPEFMTAWRTLNSALKKNMDLRHYELATIAATSSIRCSA